MKKVLLPKYPTKKPERISLASVLFTGICERPEPKRKLELYLRSLLLKVYEGGVSR